jgi:hypothetical protein
MKRDADRKAIGIWLECYNNLNATDFHVDSYPDEDNRNIKSIDALCRDSCDLTIGIEHTRVEAFPGEMTDNARFLEVLGKLEKNPSLAEVGVLTTASIEVGVIPTGVDWKTLSSDLAAFLKEHVFKLGQGQHTLMFVQGSVLFPIEIEKRIHLKGQPGSFLVARHWPGKSNEPSLWKVFEQKLPKLKASQADQKILLLEQNSVAGSVLSDVASYFASQGFPAWLPDEIWLLWTGALETEQYMHVAQMYPKMSSHKADWKDGKISTKYP